MLNLSKRETGSKEYLDLPEASDKDINETFRFLRFVNSFGGGYNVTTSALSEILRPWPKSKPIEILDAGCGEGDAGLDILRWGRRNGFNILYKGIDREVRLVEIAKARTKGWGAEYSICDMMTGSIPESDITVIALTLHHFTDEEIDKLIPRLLARTRFALAINDLRRSTLTYFAAYLLTRFVKKMPWRGDVCLSVRKGFTVDEMACMLNRLGLDGTIKKRFSGRISVIIKNEEKKYFTDCGPFGS